MDNDIDTAIGNSSVWKAKDDIIQSVPGVGPVLSRTILSNAPETGTLDRKQIAALIGVAPLNQDSGTLRGRRTVWGGRRSCLAGFVTSTTTSSIVLNSPQAGQRPI